MIALGHICHDEMERLVPTAAELGISIIGGGHCNELVGETIDGYFLSDGTPIHNDSVYSVLTTDYLYARPDINFHLYDTDPYYTGMNYHEPTIDYIISFDTSPGNPLNNHLDNTPRQSGSIASGDWDEVSEILATD